MYTKGSTAEDKLWEKWEYGSFDTYDNNNNNKRKSIRRDMSINNSKSSSKSDTVPSTTNKDEQYSAIPEETTSTTFSTNDSHNTVESIPYPPIYSTKSRVDLLWSQLSDDEVTTSIDVLLKFCSDERIRKMDNVLSQRTNNIRVVYENPSNANNVWAALRTIDSYGIQFVDIIIDSSNYNQEWRKGIMYSALGSQKWLTLCEHPDSKSCITYLKEQGYKVYASDLNERSISIHDIPVDSTTTDSSNCNSNGSKVAIIMGNVENGISQYIRDNADGLFSIPMKGFAESFNLSAASAILCAIMESRGALTPNLGPNLKQRILLTWLSRSVRGSMALLRRSGINVKGNSVYNTIGRISTNP